MLAEKKSVCVFGFCGVLGIDDDVMTPYVLCSGLILF